MYNALTRALFIWFEWSVLPSLLVLGNGLHYLLTGIPTFVLHWWIRNTIAYPGPVGKPCCLNHPKVQVLYAVLSTSVLYE